MIMRSSLSEMALGATKMPDGRIPYDENAPRKPTNVTMNADLIEQARGLGINISRACVRGVADAVSQAKAERWQMENREAFGYADEFVRKNGLPLSRFRRF